MPQKLDFQPIQDYSTPSKSKGGGGGGGLDFQPIAQAHTPDAYDEGYTDDPSTLEWWDNLWFNKATTDLPTKALDLIAEPLMQYGESGGNEKGAGGWYRGPALYAGGFLHNLGEGISGLTSPLNLATSVVGKGATLLNEGSKAIAGLGQAGKVATGTARAVGGAERAANIAGKLDTATRALSVPQIASGAARFARGMTSDDDVSGWTDIGTGLVEGLTGFWGLRSNLPKVADASTHVPGEPTQGAFDFGEPPAPTRPRPTEGQLELIMDDDAKSVYRGQRPPDDDDTGGGGGGPDDTGGGPEDGPTVADDANAGEPLPHIIVRSDWTGVIEKYKKLGYVSGGQLEDGRAFMIHKDAKRPTRPNIDDEGGGGGETLSDRVYPKLPRDLSGGAPRYGDRELHFESDLDKALYIIAKEKPSKADSRYMRFVMDHIDLADEAEARAQGKAVRKAIGEIVQGDVGQGPISIRRLFEFDDSPAPKEHQAGMFDDITEQEMRVPPDDDDAVDMTFGGQWALAVKSAESLGIDYTKFNDVRDLRDAIMMKLTGGATTGRRTKGQIKGFEPTHENLADLIDPDSLWRDRPNDPPDIAMKRQELAMMMKERRDPESIHDMTDEEAARGHQLLDELGEFDNLMDIQEMESRSPKYAPGEPRGWEPQGTTPEAREQLFERIARVFERKTDTPFEEINFTQLQSGLARAVRDSGAWENPLGHAFAKLDLQAKLNLVRDYQQRSRTGGSRPTTEQFGRPDSELLERAAAHGIDTRQKSREQIEALIQQSRDAMVRSQEMRVPGVRDGNTGLDNVAMGGADPRVLDVLGSSLYSRPGPVVTIKELLQNAFDEHKIAGVKEPVRVITDSHAPNPIVKGDKAGYSITVRDRGRGLLPEQIYTVLTDMGKTGKAGIESAAGGFGFAKAAPFLGGKYATIRSVVDTPKGRMRYTFQGRPMELKNQVKGVPLHVEKVGNDVPTGLEIGTWYDEKQNGFYQASEWASNMTERSSNLESGILLAETYDARPDHVRRWLDETPQNPIRDTEYNSLNNIAKTHTSQPLPDLKDTVTADGAKINIHYETTPDLETSQYGLHMMNKGMYQGSKQGSYGDATANVPENIVADIIATVEEGHADYPFSANREQISDKVTAVINKWVEDNIVSGVQKKRVAEIQRKYDAIGPLNPKSMEHDVHFYDDGNRFTPDEINWIANDPHFNNALGALEEVHRQMLAVADSLGWMPEIQGATWTRPSQRLKKFGLLMQGADRRGSTTLGIHIPRPDDMNNSAILINIFEHLNKASRKDKPIDFLTTELFTTIAHEQAHIPGGTHDKNFAYRDADLRAKFGQANTGQWLDALGAAFDDGSGRIKPEISDLLSIYNSSRTRPASGDSAVLASGISSKGRPDTVRPTWADVEGALTGQNQPKSVGPPPPSTPVAGGRGGGGGGRGRGSISGAKKKPVSALREAYNLPRAATTTLDLSAPLRQGLPLIFTKEWRGSWKQMMRAGFSGEEAYQKTLTDIKARPMFARVKDRFGIEIKGPEGRSFAEKVGMKLSELSGDLSAREEATASNWVETGGMFGKNNPIQRGYKQSIGRFTRGSNRAYTAFLNQLRADTFENLINEATADFKAGTKGARDPNVDLAFAREIADFVNTATGRGPLKMARPTIKDGRLALKESDFERASKTLTDVLFSPRLMASRMRMMNPMTYAMASPFVRKQYLRAAASTVLAWGTVAALAKGAGADVEDDMNSSDFGKIKIGNTRLDPAGGFQQYFVALSRLITGRVTSSNTGEDFETGAGYRAETRKDIAERFGANKLHPVAKFAYDLWNAAEYQPFHVMDRTLQLFIPLIIQDTMELASQDPSLMPLLAPVIGGMGTQTYDKGESRGKIISPNNDWIFEGGSTGIAEAVGGGLEDQ